MVYVTFSVSALPLHRGWVQSVGLGELHSLILQVFLFGAMVYILYEPALTITFADCC